MNTNRWLDQMYAVQFSYVRYHDDIKMDDGDGDIFTGYGLSADLMNQLLGLGYDRQEIAQEIWDNFPIYRDMALIEFENLIDKDLPLEHVFINIDTEIEMLDGLDIEVSMCFTLSIYHEEHYELFCAFTLPEEAELYRDERS
ncbi:hypothetical protein MASR2M15_08690 [Anaerolineales bacterium]